MYLYGVEAEVSTVLVIGPPQEKKCQRTTLYVKVLFTLEHATETQRGE